MKKSIGPEVTDPVIGKYLAQFDQEPSNHQIMEVLFYRQISWLVWIINLETHNSTKTDTRMYLALTIVSKSYYIFERLIAQTSTNHSSSIIKYAIQHSRDVCNLGLIATSPMTRYTHLLRRNYSTNPEYTLKLDKPHLHLQQTQNPRWIAMHQLPGHLPLSNARILVNPSNQKQCQSLLFQMLHIRINVGTIVLYVN